MGLGLVIAIGNGEFGAGAAEVLCGRPGKAVLVGNADDQALASIEIDDFHGGLRFFLLQLCQQGTARHLRLGRNVRSRLRFEAQLSGVRQLRLTKQDRQSDRGDPGRYGIGA